MRSASARSPSPSAAADPNRSCTRCARSAPPRRPQLTLLDCEDELLGLAERVRIAHFLQASRAVDPGPYDVSLVEGSITTAADIDRIKRVREQSRLLVTIGACATSGGIQAVRNFAEVAEFRSVVYARPEYIQALGTSTPIAAHVPVDHELRGCPIDRRQLLELLTALLAARRPHLPTHSVCQECKLRGTSCVLVSGSTPCLGPVTQAGCGAICPAYGRGCYGCFGPMPGANPAALEPALRAAGMGDAELGRVYRTFNVGTPEFGGAQPGGGQDEPPQ